MYLSSLFFAFFQESRIAMIHSLANIEQWAIDLSWDVMGRFSTVKINEKALPMEFFDDFIKVADDEAKVRSKYLYF